LRSALLWDVTQLRYIVSSRRFGITYLSHLPASGLKTEPIDCTQTSTNRHRLTAWKSEDLIYNASEAWNFTRLQVVSIWTEFFHSERAGRWLQRKDCKFLPYHDVTPQNKVNLTVTLRKIQVSYRVTNLLGQ